MKFKFLYANRIVPHGTPHFAMSHLGYSQKNNARLVLVKTESLLFADLNKKLSKLLINQIVFY